MIDMKNTNLVSVKNREDEKGAALVMALLVSFLLLVASAGLMLEATTNTMNVTDSTSEQQAFNAAESGIQAAVYVLRDNVTLPDSLRLDTTKPATDKANRIDYLKALNPVGSNLTTAGMDATPRMSRWMAYDTTRTDRVAMGGDGYAYKLDISDPDHTGALVTYSSGGRLTDCDGCDPITTPIRERKTYGSGANTLIVEYVPQASLQIDTTGGSASTSFGTFRITKSGTGADMVSSNRFELVIRMTQPYDGVRVIRGYVMKNNCTSGDCTIPVIRFDSSTFTLQGSVIVLNTVGGNPIGTTYQTGPPPGYDATLLPSSGGTAADSSVVGTMSSPEPIRLLIKSTGYGPRGSTKQLEAIIQKNFFNGLTAPATLTLIGPNNTPGCPLCNPAIPATTFNFEPGSSNVVDYSGRDQVSTDIIPPIGTNDPGRLNLDAVSDSVDGLPPHPFNGNIIGVPSDISLDTPTWLSSPAALDAAVKSLRNTADSSGRYFPSGVAPSGTYPFGNPNGTGITFCDGDCVFTGEGGGILVVTGKLTLHGAFSFSGLIIVTGQEGVDRRGAGNGEIFGNMVIAPYVNSSVLPATEPVSSTFLSPQYDLSGGGNSTIAYNSTALSNGLTAVNNFVLGVVEK